MVSDFNSKEDLVKACMASVHIPYFMNKRFSARHRGRRYSLASLVGMTLPERVSAGLGEAKDYVKFGVRYKS